MLKLPLIKSTILLLQIITVLWSIGFLFFVGISHIHTSLDMDKVKAAPIVILTGDKGRINQGFELAQDILGKNILITGVYKSIDKPSMLEHWGNGYIQESMINIDYNARNTAENAHQTAKWLNENELDHAIIVTSSYHIPRALMIMNAVSPEISFHTYGVKPQYPVASIKFWQIMQNEYNKMLVMKICLTQPFFKCF